MPDTGPARKRKGRLSVVSCWLLVENLCQSVKSVSKKSLRLRFLCVPLSLREMILAVSLRVFSVVSVSSVVQAAVVGCQLKTWIPAFAGMT